MSSKIIDPAQAKSARQRAYWEKHASKYDVSTRLLSRPLPGMLARIAEAAEGADRVLEVAAGTGLVTPTLAQRAKTVVATDYAEGMLEQLRAKMTLKGVSNVHCEQADIYALRYEPQSFDLVVAANVLHLVPDLAGALSALLAMLKPGGTLIVPTFCHDETRVAWLVSRLLAIASFPGHRRFTTSRLTEEVRQSGIQVTRSETLPGLLPIGYVQGVLQRD